MSNATVNARANKLKWDLSLCRNYARVLVERAVNAGDLRVDDVDREELIDEAVQAAWLHVPSDDRCPDDEMAMIWAVRSSVRSLFSGHYLAGCVVKRGSVRLGDRMVPIESAATAPDDSLTIREYQRFWRELREVLSDFGCKKDFDLYREGRDVAWRNVVKLKTVCRAFAHDFATERRIR
jgi:hypothetical protein